jgi:3-phenylpropionate/trans-cinnamate dioxygenase ferredoxin subunit
VKTVDIGVLEDFVDGEARQLRADDHVFVVVRIDRDVFVLDDRCSHEDFSLAEGEVNVEQREIDGQPMSFPATRPVAHYEVSTHDGRLEVMVP